MKLIHFAIVLLTINLCLLSCVNFGFSAPADETLYFQTYTSILPNGLELQAMNKSIQNPAQQANYSSANRGFISQPLAEDFIFQTVNVTVYHDAVPSGPGNFTMYATLDAANASGDAYWFSDQYGTQLAPGSRVDSVLINVAVQLFEGDSISVYVGPIDNGNDIGLDMYWGNSTYPSSISYAGTAYYNYIPEFPSTLLLFIIIADTSLALIVCKSHAKKRQIQARMRVPKMTL
ncbi:MAG: hypothetical protein ABSG57_09680 [Candidatus Bathyarchaeia archaeon]